METLRRRQDKVRFIQARHEEAAAVYGMRLRQVHPVSSVFASPHPDPVADKGAAAKAQFVDGVAVLVRFARGAMAEASGQQITYLPK